MSRNRNEWRFTLKYFSPNILKKGLYLTAFAIAIVSICLSYQEVVIIEINKQTSPISTQDRTAQQNESITSTKPHITGIFKVNNHTI